MKETTLRQAAGAVRKILAGTGATVRAQSVSFEGFGYGRAGFVFINSDKILAPEDRAEIAKLAGKIKAEGGSSIVFQLGGLAYMFGGTIKAEGRA